jgi:translation elongation factor EF-4
VQDELIYNISHPASGVREVAYTCLVRLLRHAPTRWPAVLPGYMAALEVQYPAVTVTDLIEPREFLGKIVAVCGGARTL